MVVVVVRGNPAPDKFHFAGRRCLPATGRNAPLRFPALFRPLVCMHRACTEIIRSRVESHRRYSAGNSRYNLDIQVERRSLIVARDRGTENPERFRARSDGRGNFV